MRLAQAARKLSITTEDIVDFLEIRGITIEKDSNAKLDEEAVRILFKYFEVEEEKEQELVPADAVQVKEEPQAESVEQDESDKDEQLTEVDEKNHAEEHLETEEDVEGKDSSLADASELAQKKSFKTVDELLESDEVDSGQDFVIKAPKVELKGLNVIGKIDLPEPKVKPKSEVEGEDKAEAKNKLKAASRKSYPKKNSNRKEKRELSPAEIRKREDQKAERKRKRIEKERKQKREQFYQEKVLKPKQVVQKSKAKKTKKIKEETNENLKPQPKTVLGKVWRWLNT